MRRLVLAEHWRIETVARRFGVHHSVVRRAIRDGVPAARPRPSRLDAFKPYIVKRLTELPELTAARLLLELRDRGFPLAITQLRRYVAQVRTPVSRKAYLRVEFEPAEQAQLDWGSFGHMRIGSAQRPLVGVRHGAVLVPGHLHRLLPRPADGDLLPDAPPRAGVLWRGPPADRLRQPQVGGAAPRGLDRAVQSALPRLRGALPVRGHRRAGALPPVQGTGGGVDQIHPPLVLLRPVLLFPR